MIAFKTIKFWAVTDSLALQVCKDCLVHNKFNVISKAEWHSCLCVLEQAATSLFGCKFYISDIAIVENFVRTCKSFPGESDLCWGWADYTLYTHPLYLCLCVCACACALALARSWSSCPLTLILRLFTKKSSVFSSLRQWLNYGQPVWFITTGKCTTFRACNPPLTGRWPTMALILHKVYFCGVLLSTWIIIVDF